MVNTVRGRECFLGLSTNILLVYGGGRSLAAPQGGPEKEERIFDFSSDFPPVGGDCDDGDGRGEGEGEGEGGRGRGGRRPRPVVLGA